MELSGFQPSEVTASLRSFRLPFTVYRLLFTVERLLFTVYY